MQKGKMAVCGGLTNSCEQQRSEMKSLGRIQLFATPCTETYPAPPSMGFSSQEYWGGLPFPSPEDLPNPGIEPGFPALQADALPTEPPGKLKRREAKGREEERHAHLNAEFQRIARRDKKGFLSDQCKEIEGNNGMGKTSDLFKKIRDSREHFRQRWAQ